MKNKAKYIVMMVATVGQIIGIIFLFVNLKAALLFYVCYIIAIILLFVLLIRERIKEKREDDQNDYRDY
ncbi:hypothetical protein [Fredinandcohnia quinoae]|uniref:Uncharacterized protein n=1 Tax=Fredinandcohnia quinoae TaxID=2918902 RepID=A0AAW5EE78_9BACI|nr:hypothetical protein [Fredinandcohnia sp. SECRCQ15]MCH1627069.1 hypothetical protein [Fredinandcohnia sp. SECRCQ15]